MIVALDSLDACSCWVGLWAAVGLGLDNKNRLVPSISTNSMNKVHMF